MTKPIYVLNGPNLSRLGTREPEIYGSTTLAEIEQSCRGAAGDAPVEFRQTNAEHEMVGWIQEAADEALGVVINPAGFTFNSMPVHDALRMVSGPVIELHLSNIHRREEQYRNSLISRAATGVICGLGANGYRLAVEAVLRLTDPRL